MQVKVVSSDKGMAGGNFPLKLCFLKKAFPHTEIQTTNLFLWTAPEPPWGSAGQGREDQKASAPIRTKKILKYNFNT